MPNCLFAELPTFIRPNPGRLQFKAGRLYNEQAKYPAFINFFREWQKNALSLQHTFYNSPSFRNLLIDILHTALTNSSLFDHSFIRSPCHYSRFGVCSTAICFCPASIRCRLLFKGSVHQRNGTFDSSWNFFGVSYLNVLNGSRLNSPSASPRTITVSDVNLQEHIVHYCAVNTDVMMALK